MEKYEAIIIKGKTEQDAGKVEIDPRDLAAINAKFSIAAIDSAKSGFSNQEFTYFNKFGAAVLMLLPA